MPTTYEAIATVTVGSGGASSIDFQNIPATYTDLLIKISPRGTYSGIQIKLNNDSAANYSWRNLRGDGSNASSESSGGFGSPYNQFVYMRTSSSTSDTASTFGNGEIYIPNYTSSNQKSVSCDGVSENNGTTAFATLTAGLWTGTAAITRVTLTMDAGGTLSQHSTATLYGIKNS